MNVVYSKQDNTIEGITIKVLEKRTSTGFKSVNVWNLNLHQKRWSKWNKRQKTTT